MISVPSLALIKRDREQHNKEVPVLRTHNEVYEAVEQAFKDRHELRHVKAEEVARQLVLGGYLQEELPVLLVADALDIVEAEEQAFAPGIRPADL